LIRGGITPRRRAPRRAEDHHRFVADWYESDLLYVALAILVCSVADAALTLTLVQLGAREVNLFMVGLVHGDPQTFVGWKMVLTGAGLIHLVIRHRVRLFGRIPVHQVLYLILAAYAGLIAYELWLLAYLIPAP
jgi:hypothetical protein